MDGLGQHDHHDGHGLDGVTASVDTRQVFVSSAEGNDSNDGMSEVTPKRTIAAGYGLIRDGYPDWLLLRRGDTWTDETLGTWTKSGRSLTEPVLIGAYGTAAARPLLRTGQAAGFTTQYGPNENYSLHDLALVGIAFIAHTYDGSTSTEGFCWLMPGANVLIEDCKFSGYHEDMSVQGQTNASGSGLTNLRIRRCVIVDSYATSGHSQGIFLDRVDNGGLVEENIFDHNGWNESVPAAPATVFNRNMYFSRHNGPLTVRGNISANSASEGLQQRSGGLCEDNLFLRNSTGVTFGQWQSVWPAEAASGTVRNNVVLDARDIGTNPRGFGVQFQQVDGVEAYGNIIAHQRSGTGNVLGIALDYNYLNVNLHDNIVYD